MDGGSPYPALPAPTWLISCREGSKGWQPGPDSGYYYSPIPWRNNHAPGHLHYLVLFTGLFPPLEGPAPPGKPPSPNGKPPPKNMAAVWNRLGYCMRQLETAGTLCLVADAQQMCRSWVRCHCD